MDSSTARTIKNEGAAHGEGKFPLERFVPYLLTRVTNRLSQNFAKALKPAKLNNLHWRVLAVLAAGDGRSITELSAYAITDHSTLSRTLDRLEEKGLVRRARSDSDGRLTEIFLTPKGSEMFERLEPIATAQYEWAVRDIDDDELAQFAATLRKMLDNIRISPFA